MTHIGPGLAAAMRAAMEHAQREYRRALIRAEYEARGLRVVGGKPHE